jgi:hypothetical protein
VWTIVNLNVSARGSLESLSFPNTIPRRRSKILIYDNLSKTFSHYLALENHRKVNELRSFGNSAGSTSISLI